MSVAVAWDERAAQRQPGEDVVPVVPPLAGLFPDGGLRRGSVVSVPEAGSLPLALAAGASAAGGWGAAGGVAEGGGPAAAGMGGGLGPPVPGGGAGGRRGEGAAAPVGRVGR